MLNDNIGNAPAIVMEISSPVLPPLEGDSQRERVITIVQTDIEQTIVACEHKYLMAFRFVRNVVDRSKPCPY